MNRVLVVEDEPDILELVRRILTSNGYDVVTAINGEEGLVKAARDKPDLVVCDLVMPGLSGLELIRLMRNKMKKRTPVLVLTALGRDVDKKYATEAGADAYLTKPFRVNDLLEVIERIQQSYEKRGPDGSPVSVAHRVD